MSIPSRLERVGASFSFVGLAVATLCFAASLTPSLLPRHFAVQGVLSGFALGVGYAVGVLLVWTWQYLEIPPPKATLQRACKLATSAVVTVVVVSFLWRATVWQNSIRQLMEMEPVATAYPFRVALLALLTGLLLLVTARGLGLAWRFVHSQLQRLVPRRVSYVVATLLVAVAVLLVANKLVARWALDVADAAFAELDEAIEDDVQQPADALASGSAASLIAWDTIGRRGKHFVVQGPTQQQISEFAGKPAARPLRVYVGLRSKGSPRERATLALEELIRVGGFRRSLLVIAVPTGTGWLDPGGVDTLEYLHGGDTAIATMQYSYLPSWITILVEPDRSRDDAAILFDTVYNHWRSLPKDQRPRLYLHGLSLGALGSAASADLFTVFEDPPQGAVWSGPPFASSVWSRATRYRNAGSPMWLPTFRDGSMLRFTGRECSLPAGGQRWGPMRCVYIQHASDPMTFFSPDLAYHSPGWLDGPRGPDVSPYLRWYPLVTFLQSAFDLPMATSVPAGYGHNFAPASYIDAWIAVTDPPGWSASDTARLKAHFDAAR